MEKKKNKNGVIALLIIIIIVLTVLCLLFAMGKINLKTNTDGNNQISENGEDNSKLLAVGLSMYKYANQIETLFDATEDGVITNYDIVSGNFTNSFINTAKNSNMCWPTEKQGTYYLNNDCAAGGTSKYTFKSIVLKEDNSNKLLFTVNLNLETTVLNDNGTFESTNKDVIQEFEIILENNIWKINKFTYNSMLVSF